jgi:hypothetical protein
LGDSLEEAGLEKLRQAAERGKATRDAVIKSKHAMPCGCIFHLYKSDNLYVDQLCKKHAEAYYEDPHAYLGKIKAQIEPQMTSGRDITQKVKTKKALINFNDELWTKLEEGQTVNVKIFYVKERKEVFIIDTSI